MCDLLFGLFSSGGRCLRFSIDLKVARALYRLAETEELKLAINARLGVCSCMSERVNGLLLVDALLYFTFFPFAPL